MGRTIRATVLLADFNGDGIDDLVVGVPGEDIGATTNAGAVNVIYGSESGMADGPRQQLTQALAEPGDGFGTAVATGDFNGDRAVDARSGEDDGLGPDPDGSLYYQGSAGVPGTAETGDRFAAALSA